MQDSESGWYVYVFMLPIFSRNNLTYICMIKISNLISVWLTLAHSISGQVVSDNQSQQQLFQTSETLSKKVNKLPVQFDMQTVNFIAPLNSLRTHSSHN